MFLNDSNHTEDHCALRSFVHSCSIAYERNKIPMECVCWLVLFRLNQINCIVLGSITNGSLSFVSVHRFSVWFSTRLKNIQICMKCLGWLGHSYSADKMVLFRINFLSAGRSMGFFIWFELVWIGLNILWIFPIAFCCVGWSCANYFSYSFISSNFSVCFSACIKPIVFDVIVCISCFWCLEKHHLVL